MHVSAAVSEKEDGLSALENDEGADDCLSYRSKSNTDYEVLSQHGISQEVFEKIQRKNAITEMALKRNNEALEREEHLK